MNSYRVREKMMIACGILGILLGVIGGHWDGWLHVKQGHELLALPHIVIITGFFFFWACGVLALTILFKNRGNLNATQSLGIKITALGGLLTPVALLLDEGWHRFINLDMTAWSFPHALMFFFVACVLFGLSLFSKSQSRESKTRMVSLEVVFFATIYMLALFSLQDFDQPSMSWVSKTRYGFTYPFAVTGIMTFISFVTFSITKRIGAATLAALIAWILHAGTGQLVGIVGGFSHTALSFPVIIPALALDLWLLQERKRTSTYRCILTIAFVSASVCFWTVISWATLYTKLPQQISGAPKDWLLWYIIFVPSFAVACAVLESLISKSTATNK